MDKTAITLPSIRAARERIAPFVRTTALEASPYLTKSTGHPVLLKLEMQQITGSFKLRGATNAVCSLSDAQKQKGVVACSTGNHGRGLAHAAKQAGVHCVVCMSKLVPQNKLDGIAALGADIKIVGNSQDEAEHEVQRLVLEECMVQIPPFDHADIISGQATLALELLEQAQHLGQIVVPVSGGGLIAGVAIAAKAINPSIHITGVSMERGAAMYASIQAGKPVLEKELPSLADSLGGGIGLDNRYTFDIVQELVDELLLVSEEEIAAGIRHAYFHEQQIIEGSGAVCIAALLAGKTQPKRPCALVCSGKNLDMQLHKRIIDGENVDLLSEANA